MGANRRPKAIGQFGWQDADVGVECLRCGILAVFCDFEAATHFRARGWSTAAADAIKRFRCRCGSREVRFRPVPIAMRPKPIPPRPATLRPIYREDERAHRRRGVPELPDRPAIEAALAALERAIYAKRYGGEQVADADVAAALTLLRPFLYDTSGADSFAAELAAIGEQHGAHADTVLVGIRTAARGEEVTLLAIWTEGDRLLDQEIMSGLYATAISCERRLEAHPAAQTIQFPNLDVARAELCAKGTFLRAGLRLTERRPLLAGAAALAFLCLSDHTA